MIDPEHLPPFISLRGLAVELCPAERPLNAFKQQLRRILRSENVPLRHAGKQSCYYLSDLMAHVPYLIRSWVEARHRKAA